jgi:hypothetical protein
MKMLDIARLVGAKAETIVVQVILRNVLDFKLSKLYKKPKGSKVLK